MFFNHSLRDNIKILKDQNLFQQCIIFIYHFIIILIAAVEKIRAVILQAHENTSIYLYRLLSNPAPLQKQHYDRLWPSSYPKTDAWSTELDTWLGEIQLPGYQIEWDRLHLIQAYDWARLNWSSYNQYRVRVYHLTSYDWELLNCSNKLHVLYCRGLPLVMSR